MEYPNEGNNLGGAVFIPDPIGNDKELVPDTGNKQEAVYQTTYTTSSSNVVSETGVYKEETNTYTETNTTTVGDATVMEQTGILEHSEAIPSQITSEVTHVTEKYEKFTVSHTEGSTTTNESTENYQEYVSVPHQEKGAGQSTEFVSDYMLNRAENVYAPEGQGYSTGLVPEDNTPVQNQQQAAQLQMSETNWVTEEQGGDGNLSRGDNANETDPLEDQGIKDECPYTTIADSIENVSEAGDENAGENVGNEEDTPNASLDQDNIEEDGGNDGAADESYIKEELSPDKMEESDNASNEQQVVDSNNAAVSADVPNVSAPSAPLPEECYVIDEGTEVTEIQEGEYTIVEGPSSLDMSANEAPSNSDGTVVEIEYEDSQDTAIDEETEIYLSELRSQADSRQSISSQSSETRRRGRRSGSDIPMHVRGHDFNKPVESIPNGRALPKPRLGVKVPYRNLTSQIVSKAEIEKEVMERSRLKQEQAQSRGDIIFARKLTQRLARKIAPSPEPPKTVAQTESNHSQRKAPTRAVQTNQDSTKIHNDSDLLAILEGEGEEMPVLPKEVPLPQIDETNIKMLEREIALQQLQDLPNQPPKVGIYRGRKAPVLTAEASVAAKAKTMSKSDGRTRESGSSSQNTLTRTRNPAVPFSGKENETARGRAPAEDALVSPRRDHSTGSSPRKQPVEIEPQVKVNMVLKTYSRKRKTDEPPETYISSPVPKKPMYEDTEIKVEKADQPAPTNVYVTKSSRVIKRKVIWDPDEAPVRSPKPSLKPDVQPTRIATIKSIKPAERTTDKIPEPVKKPSLEKSSERKAPVAEKSVKSSEKTLVKKSSASPMDKTSSKNKIPIKSKKLHSELDRLLMDEGAVKMLYELKNTEEPTPKKKKDVYSVEKAQKEILKKAHAIKSELQQTTSNESPISLRKKEGFTPSPAKPAHIISTERKMSKDSTRSSLHTPPGSPAYSQSSMLVRRRSSSSMSSSEEVDDDEPMKVSKKSTSKKVKKPEISEPPEIKEVSMSSSNSFTVKKYNKTVTIGLNYVDDECYCTVEVLEELTAALKKFANDKDCHVVCVTSNCKAFCLGLDYVSVVSEVKEERREKAEALAEAVRDFLLCLLKFPKVLIAGIQGDCVGLGVTMLPLFDMVIASDTATFSTPYAKLGCVAEAGFLLAPPVFTNHGLAAELLFTTQKLTADDAFRRGLVSRLCWPEKYNETLKNILTSISKGSKQSLEATKKQLQKNLMQMAEAAINSETNVLVEHWISSECQNNFAELIESDD